MEQIIYAAHYDKNEIEGSPRKGWVKIGLIVDLSLLISKTVEKESLFLKEAWTKHWDKIESEKLSVKLLVNKLDLVRVEVKIVLQDLN